MFVYMPINALYALMSMSYFGGTPYHVSITEIAYASGMLAGGMLLGVIGGLKKRIPLITASILLMGVSLTISGFLPTNGFIVFAVCCGLMGFSFFYSGVQMALYRKKYNLNIWAVFSLETCILVAFGIILSVFATGESIIGFISALLLFALEYLSMIPSMKAGL